MGVRSAWVVLFAFLCGCLAAPEGSPVTVYVQNGWHRDAVVHVAVDGSNATVQFDAQEGHVMVPWVERALETRVTGVTFSVRANESLSGERADASFRVTGENHVVVNLVQDRIELEKSVRGPGFD